MGAVGEFDQRALPFHLFLTLLHQFLHLYLLLHKDYASDTLRMVVVLRWTILARRREDYFVLLFTVTILSHLLFDFFDFTV